jgi:iron complex transport system substrate-binding protein
MIRKVFGLILVLMMMGLVACRPRTAQNQGAAGTAVSGSRTGGSRTVTDVWGREVTIPAKAERIICLGSGAPRIAAYLDVIDMLVGAEDADIRSMVVLRDYSPVYHETLKVLPSVGQGGGSGNNNGYPEQIITMAPDIILAGFSAEAAIELQTQTNIPVVSVRYISNGLANDSFYDAMRVFAEAVGAQERCEAVLSFIDRCKADLNSRTANVPDGEKLKAYTSAVTFNGRHGFSGTYSKFGPFTVTNALNVADEVSEEGFYEADLEKIIVWDPDVIFLDPGNRDLVNDEYATNPAYFRTVRAVREGRVYTMPSFNNMGTNISYALMDAYYAGIVLFPQQFADVDIAEKSAEILTSFLGQNIYDLMAAGGLYYGMITIGE